VSTSTSRSTRLRTARCANDADWRRLLSFDLDQYTLRSWGYPRPDALRAAYRYLRERGHLPEATVAVAVENGHVRVAVRDVSTPTTIPGRLWPTLSRLLTTCASAIRDDTEFRPQPNGLAAAKVRRWDPRSAGSRWSYIGGLDHPCNAITCGGHW